MMLTQLLPVALLASSALALPWTSPWNPFQKGSGRDNTCEVYSSPVTLGTFKDTQSFIVRGTAWDAAKLGAHGEGLQQRLNDECAALLLWEFHWLSDDTANWTKQDEETKCIGFDWYAQFSLPVGHQACVGNAVLLSGGKTRNKCIDGGDVTPSGKLTYGCINGWTSG